MENKLSNEQKAHDLAVAYAAYISTTRKKEIDIEPFYQEYEHAYEVLLPIVKRYN